MTTYHFDQTVVWANLGSFVRVAGGVRSNSVIDPVTSQPATVVQDGATQVGFLIASPDGRLTFTTTDIPKVTADFGAGPVTLIAGDAVGANTGGGGGGGGGVAVHFDTMAAFDAAYAANLVPVNSLVTVG